MKFLEVHDRVVREALGALYRRFARPQRIVEVQRDGAYRHAFIMP